MPEKHARLMLAPLVRRRSLVQTALAGLGGVAVAPLLPPAPDAAVALASARGPVVTPDPIKPKITKSGLAVELVDFSTPPRTSAGRPYALLNFLCHAGDGSGRLFANDSRGVIWLIDRATGAAQSFLDLRQARGSAFLPGSLQMGLRSFAFHPDFAKSGTAGFGKLYTTSTETVASRPPGVKVFDNPAPYSAIHDGVVAEWSVDPATPSRVDPASRRELFRITQFKKDHQLDQPMFRAKAVPGGEDYGELFVTIGDGGNVPARPDPYDLAQNPASAHGKLFRIDPLRQADGSPYGVPRDNPFVGRSGYLPEIWALGLRHPQNLSFDRGDTSTMILTDIGQHYIEEVNLGVRGANYGWPLREGTFVTDRTDQDVLYALPSDDPTYGFTYPVAQYDHDDVVNELGLAAICGGFVYRGSVVPDLAGQYLFGDLVVGRVFHVPVADLRLGSRATVEELTLRRNGEEITLLELTGGDPASSRVDLRFGEDEDGELYILTKRDGSIRKLAPA